MPKPLLERAALRGATMDSARLARASFRDAPEEPIDPATESAEELRELEDSFVGRALREEKRFEQVTDSEYWLCLCFQSREQAEAFAKETAWGSPDDKYIDGTKVAKTLGITLPEAPRIAKTRPKSPRLLALVAPELA